MSGAGAVGEVNVSYHPLRLKLQRGERLSDAIDLEGLPNILCQRCVHRCAATISVLWKSVLVDGRCNKITNLGAPENIRT